MWILVIREEIVFLIMKCEESVWYSDRINRRMRVKVYGHYGPAFIAFPCQEKQKEDFSNSEMIDSLSHLLKGGKMKLYCIESNDDDSVFTTDLDTMRAAYKLEMYHQFIIHEIVPFVLSNQGECKDIYLIGTRMGASHAANTFFRKPELFAGFIALSGNYDISTYFGKYFDNNIYKNSPIHYLANMDEDDPKIDVYNSKKMIVVLGQAIFEDEIMKSNHRLSDIASKKHISIDFNFWDENSIQEWYRWKYQMPYFINKVL